MNANSANSNRVGSDRLTIPGTAEVERVLRSASGRLSALGKPKKPSESRLVAPAIITATMTPTQASATTAISLRGTIFPLLPLIALITSMLVILQAPWYSSVSATVMMITFFLPSSLRRTQAPAFSIPSAIISYATPCYVLFAVMFIKDFNEPTTYIPAGLAILVGGAVVFALAWLARGRYMERNSLTMRAFAICMIIGGQTLLAL
jgi:hypothetical protein